MAKCSNKECGRESISFNDTCWEHTLDKKSYVEGIRKKIKKNQPLIGCNFYGVNFNALDMQGADLENACLTRADLSYANIYDANLTNAEALGTDFSFSDLTNSNLEKADLTRSNLYSARLWHVNMNKAVLVESNLKEADLWNSKMFNVKLWNAALKGARGLWMSNFDDARSNGVRIKRQINEEGAASAEDAYRNLKRYFMINGRYNDASWASYKEKQMEKRALWERKSFSFIPSALMDTISGYAEMPHRVIFSSAVVIFLYAITYHILGSITYEGNSAYIMNFADHLYFSIITFTTVGYGDFIPKNLPLFKLLSASEAFIGAFMMGLFIFTLARRYSAR